MTNNIKLSGKVVVGKPKAKKIKIESGRKVIKNEIVYDGNPTDPGNIDGGTF